MIQYNFKYRGAIEYEKLTLTVLSFYNEISDIAIEDSIEFLYKDHLDALDNILQSLHNEKAISRHYAKMLLYQ